MRGYEPFLKWPGGKRWLTEQLLRPFADETQATYYEPFLGGGALFFALQPDRAVLSDINDNLVRTYQAVRDNPAAVRERLAKLPVSKEDYYRIRGESPDSRNRSAARFLYLNRTCFGGLYRENKKGDFTVPYGGGERTPRKLLDTAILEHASRTLQSARLRTQDFRVSLRAAGEGDSVYCDPPYTVAHNGNGFIRYNERLFSWDDQMLLAEEAKRAARRGAFVVVSNANHPAIVELYRGCHIDVVSRLSSVSVQAKHRGLTSELVITVNGGIS